MKLAQIVVAPSRESDVSSRLDMGAVTAPATTTARASFVEIFIPTVAIEVFPS